MTDKKPIRLSNVRLSYPSVRRPADSIDLMQPRAPSFTMHIANKQSPFTFCWMMSSLMGGMMPAMSALVGYNPQKLLPPPGPTNRPMSVWDPETMLEAIGGLYGTSYEEMSGWWNRQFESLLPKPAKPVRYYIEGGHFDMQPLGTVDLDDEYIMFDRGSPTGRRLAPFVTPRWGESGVSPLRDIERFRDEMTKPWPHKVAVVKVESLDFGLIEARVLAAMGDKRVRGILLDIESAGGEIVNPQLDLYRQAFMHAPVEKKVAKKAPPAYLQHDPTKRHKRRRKGK